MNIKSLMLGLLCLPALLFAQNGVQETYTLEDCITIALQNNYDLKSASLRAETARVNLKQSTYALLPSINGSYNLGLSRGRSIDPFTNDFVNEELKFSNARLGLDATIFNGFRLMNSLKQARFNLRASEVELEQARQELVLNVTLSFLQVLNDRDIVTLTESRIVVTQEQLDRLQSLYEEETGNPADYRDLQGQIANDQTSLVRAINTLQTSELALNQWINTDKKVEANRIEALINMQPYDVTINEVLTDAFDKLPAIQAQRMRLQAADKAIAIARSQYVPEVSFFANMGTNYSSAARLFSENGSSIQETGDFVTIGNENFSVFSESTSFIAQEISYGDQFDNNVNSSLGVAVTVPIFNGFRAKNNVALEKIRNEEAQVSLDRTTQQVEQAITQSYNAMQAALNRYELAEKQVQAFEESFRIKEIRFNNGVTTSVDYITSKNNLDNARITFTSVQYEYELRKRILTFYRGGL